jgi:hypothetical protein
MAPVAAASVASASTRALTKWFYLNKMSHKSLFNKKINSDKTIKIEVFEPCL